MAESPRQSRLIGVKICLETTSQAEYHSMTDFAVARKNMIDSQIATMGVIDPVLLDILRAVPREQFVPEERRALAYTDEDLPLADGAFLLEPLIFARLAQAGEPRPNETILTIGDRTGYAAAVLAGMAKKVVALETEKGCFDRARTVWQSLSLNNILVVPGDASAGCPAYAPYAMILVNGSIPAIPSALVDQLATEGRLLGIIRHPNAQDGKAVLATKLANGSHSSKILFDASSPFLPELMPRKTFAF
jgi:protein-L-isoaspartate(D-aspartate) O-methyltransferase